MIKAIEVFIKNIYFNFHTNVEYLCNTFKIHLIIIKK